MSFPHLTSKNSGINPLGKAQELTLTADRGFFVEAGTNAATLRGFPLIAAAGSFTWTGTAATLGNAYLLTASTGAVTWTGTAASPLFGGRLTSQTGVYDETGTDATLNYSANPVAVSLSQTQIQRKNYPRAFAPATFGKRKFNFVNEFSGPSDSGNYAIVGTDVNFQTTVVGQWIPQQIKQKGRWPRPFAPSPWGHLTTQKSQNRISSATFSYALNAIIGTWTIDGIATNFNSNHVIAVATGTWNWNASAAILNKGATILATSGSFSITAPDTSLIVIMPAASGNWIWTGGILDFGSQRFLVANTNNITVTGPLTTLTYSAAVLPGSYIWSGDIATLRYSGEIFSGKGGILLLGVG